MMEIVLFNVCVCVILCNNYTSPTSYEEAIMRMIVNGLHLRNLRI